MLSKNNQLRNPRVGLDSPARTDSQEKIMQTHGYEISITKDTPLPLAEQEIRAALSAQGFGILTEIDVEATLNEKLGVTIAPYKILGACNPSLAYQALGFEPAISLLLPCNVTLRVTDDGATRISAIDPMVMMSVSQNPNIETIATEARTRLIEALAAVEAP